MVLIGEDAASQVYVRNKIRKAEAVGIRSLEYRFDTSLTQAELLALIDKLNQDPEVNGILVQLPLPSHIDESRVLEEIDVAKDVDGFSAMNVGNMCLRGGRPPLALPCTPAGCIELLQRSGVQARAALARAPGTL